MFGSEGIEVIYAKTVEEGRIQPTINNLIQNVKKQRQEIYKLNEYLISNKGKSRSNYKSKTLFFKTKI
jgi:zona occludens toxin (predicted ATPase)